MSGTAEETFQSFRAGVDDLLTAGIQSFADFVATDCVLKNTFEFAQIFNREPKGDEMNIYNTAIKSVKEMAPIYCEELAQ